MARRSKVSPPPPPTTSPDETTTDDADEAPRVEPESSEAAIARALERGDVEIADCPACGEHYYRSPLSPELPCTTCLAQAWQERGAAPAPAAASAAPPPVALGAPEEPGAIVPGPTVTHWRCVRIGADGTRAPLSYGESPEGERFTTWPVDTFSAASVMARWGDGTYQATWLVYRDAAGFRVSGRSRVFQLGAPPAPAAGAPPLTAAPIGPPLRPGQISPLPIQSSQVLPVLPVDALGAIGVHDYLVRAGNQYVQTVVSLADAMARRDLERAELSHARSLERERNYFEMVLRLVKKEPPPMGDAASAIATAVVAALHQGATDDEGDGPSAELATVPPAPPPGPIDQLGHALDAVGNILDKVPADVRDGAFRTLASRFGWRTPAP